MSNISQYYGISHIKFLKSSHSYDVDCNKMGFIQFSMRNKRTISNKSLAMIFGCALFLLSSATLDASAASDDLFILTNKFTPNILGDDIELSNDGYKLYLSVPNEIRQYYLGAAYDVQYVSTVFKTLELTGRVSDIAFSDTGNKLFIVYPNNTIHQYVLSTSFDITTATFANDNILPIDGNAVGIDISRNTLVITSNNGDIYEFDLSFAFDIGEPSLKSGNLLGSVDTTGITAAEFSPDGETLFIASGIDKKIVVYNVTAWLDDENYTPTSFSLPQKFAGPFGLEFNSNGDELYALNLFSSITEIFLNEPYTLPSSDAFEPSSTLFVDLASPATQMTYDQYSNSGTTSGPFTVIAAFSAPVTGFTANDIIVYYGQVNNLTQTPNPYIWTFTVSPSFDGKVYVSIPAGVVSDSSGNLNTYSSEIIVIPTAVTNEIPFTPPPIIDIIPFTPPPLVDVTPPILTVPADIIAEAPYYRIFGYVGTATATDAVDPNPTITNNLAISYPLGTHTITWTATDSSGNSANATQKITIKDTRPPVFDDTTNITASSDGQSTAVFFSKPIAHDRVGSASVTCDHASGDLFTVGETTVVCIAADDFDNTTYTTFTVTVSQTRSVTITHVRVDDTIIPFTDGMIIETKNPRFIGASTDIDSIQLLLCDTQVGGTNVRDDGSFKKRLDTLVPDGVCLLEAKYNNTVLFSANVMIKTNFTPPILSIPDDIVLEATGMLTIVDIGTATATDDVDSNPTITNNAPNSYGLGPYTITWTATDSSGNRAIATQKVTVQDTTAPTLSIQSNIILEATGTLTTVDIGTATATDAVDPNPTITNVTRSFPFIVGETTDTVDSNPTIINTAENSYPLGIHIIIWTSIDLVGNYVNAVQSITIDDTTAPTLSIPADITLEATGTLTTVDIGAATSTDAVDSNPTITNNAASSYLPGTHTITWTSIDSSRNRAIATQQITIQDTTPPVFDDTTNITASFDDQSTAVSFIKPTATDSVGNTSVTCDHASGDLFAVGETTVTCTATDDSGNSAHTSFTVTVSYTIPKSITITHVKVDNAIISFTDEMIIETKNPSFIGASTGIDSVQLLLCDTQVGGTNVRDDGSFKKRLATLVSDGVCLLEAKYNNEVLFSASVTIRTDITPPTLSVPADIVLEATGTLTAVNVGTATVIDAVDSESIITHNVIDDYPPNTYAITNNAVDAYSIGTHTITWTATDSSRNSITATQQITIQDTTPPVFESIGVVTQSSADGQSVKVSFTLPVATDFTSTPDVTCTPESGSLFAVGETTVTCTATDSSGNTAQKSFAVTISHTTNVDTDDPEPKHIYVRPTIHFSGATNGDPSIPVKFTVIHDYDYPNPAVKIYNQGVTVNNDVKFTLLIYKNITYNVSKISTTGFQLIDHDPNANSDDGVSTLVLRPNVNVTTLGTLVIDQGYATDVYGYVSPSYKLDIPIEVTTPPTKSITITHVIVDDAIIPFTDGMLIETKNPKFRGTSSGIDSIQLLLCNTQVGGSNVRDDGSFGKRMSAPISDGVCLLEAKYNNEVLFSASVTIKTDFTPPILSVPDDIVLEATGILTIVNIGTTTATDAVDSNPTITNNAASSYQLGAHTITWTAIDSSENSAIATQKITIQDTTPPVFESIGDVTQSSADGQSVSASFTAPVATDLASTPSVTCTPESGSLFAVGDTTVTCTATDGSGNTAHASFTVTVSHTIPKSITITHVIVDDTTIPFTDEMVIETKNPKFRGTSSGIDSIQLLLCNAQVGGSNVRDDGSFGKRMSAPISDGVCLLEAKYNNKVLFSASVTIRTDVIPPILTIPADITPPTLSVPADIVLEATGTLTAVNVGTATVIDAVDSESIITHNVIDDYPPNTYTITNNAVDAYSIGAHTITWTVTDSSRNSITATQKITIQDTTPPVFGDTINIAGTSSDGQSTAVSFIKPTATDSVSTASVTCTPESGSLFAVGDTTVTCTATDGSGNTAHASFTVTVSHTIPKSITITQVDVDGVEIPFLDGMIIDANTIKFHGTSSGIDSIQLLLCGTQVGGTNVRDDGSFKKRLATLVPDGVCLLEAKYNNEVLFSASVTIRTDVIHNDVIS